MKEVTYPESNVPRAKIAATGAQGVFPLIMLPQSFAVSETKPRVERSWGAAAMSVALSARSVTWNCMLMLKLRK